MRNADLAQAQIALKKAAYELSRQQALAAAENTTTADLQTATLAHEAATITVVNLQKQQAESKVVSPVAGVITAKKVQNGVYVQPGTELFQLSVVDKLKIESYVSVDELPRVLLGKHWSARFAGNSGNISVAVLSVNPEPSAARTYKVTWSASPAPKGWLPGMFVTLLSQQHHTANVWKLPTSALSGTEQAFVITQLKKGVARKTTAQVVGRNTQSVWCKASIADGDTILISGQHLLAEGAAPGHVVWSR
jgi:RND family efflux transporter MFP subunit